MNMHAFQTKQHCRGKQSIHDSGQIAQYHRASLSTCICFVCRVYIIYIYTYIHEIGYIYSKNLIFH